MAKQTTTMNVGIPNRKDVPRVMAIIKAADVENPTPKAIADLQGVFAEYPQLYRRAGDFANVALTQLSGATNGGRGLGVEAVETYARELRRDLGYAHANPLERLLIKDIVLCWLETNAIRSEYYAATMRGPSYRMDVGAYDDRRLSSAHKRYSRAVETLARVRRFGITMPAEPAEPAVSSDAAEPAGAGLCAVG